ncbi:MAG: hypothetical protein DDT40_01842 [candidate division WS2 bacterium]|nr:hypothetical protein [Candidatus Psychracetigena formicireducens]
MQTWQGILLTLVIVLVAIAIYDRVIKQHVGV